MKTEDRITSETQLVRLLQIGMVLEEVFEARAEQHLEAFGDETPKSNGGDGSDEIRRLLEDAVDEAADHRGRLEELIEALDADTVDYDRIESLVADGYGATKPDSFDDVLFDQLHSEESAYKYYDDLIGNVEDADADFGVSRGALLATLRDIREEEATSVERITDLMGER